MTIITVSDRERELMKTVARSARKIDELEREVTELKAKLAETEKDYERFRTEYNEKMHEKQMIIFDYEMADYKGEAESLRGWKDAVEHEVTNTCCGPNGWNDPRKMVKHIIDWNVAVALDPAVSLDAQNLIEREVAELKAQLTQALEQNTALDKQLAECERELGTAIPAPSWSVLHQGTVSGPCVDEDKSSW